MRARAATSVRDEDRETLIEHRQRLERIESEVGEVHAGVDEILAVQAQHGERLDRLETLVLTQGEILRAHSEQLDQLVKVTATHQELLEDIIRHIRR